MQVFTS